MSHNKLTGEINDRIDELKSKVIDNIERVGWHAMHVFPDGTEQTPYSFTYTIGFSPAHPEVLIVNLPHRIAHSVLATVHARITAGEKFEPGRIYSEVLRNYDVAVQDLPLEAQSEHLRWAEWYHEEAAGSWPFASVQLCWPDVHGKFPWEPGYDADAFPQRVFGLES